MNNDLSAAAIATVKATVPALRIHGLAITTRMYERLFEDAAIKALRPMAMRLMGTDDAREGVQSFIERRPGKFQGR